jgi:hypothetical protein
LIYFRATGSFDEDDGSCPSDVENDQHLVLCNSIGWNWVKEFAEKCMIFNF